MGIIDGDCLNIHLYRIPDLSSGITPQVCGPRLYKKAKMHESASEFKTQHSGKVSTSSFCLSFFHDFTW